MSQKHSVSPANKVADLPLNLNHLFNEYPNTLHAIASNVPKTDYTTAIYVPFPDPGSRGTLGPEAIPQPEPLDRPRRPGTVSDEEHNNGALGSRGAGRPDVMTPPERPGRPRHLVDEEKSSKKSLSRSPGSRGPPSADVFPTPELGKTPRRSGIDGRGTHFPPASQLSSARFQAAASPEDSEGVKRFPLGVLGTQFYSPMDDVGYKPSRSNVSNRTTTKIDAVSIASLSGHPENIISGGKSLLSRPLFGHPGDTNPGNKSQQTQCSRHPRHSNLGYKSYNFQQFDKAPSSDPSSGSRKHTNLTMYDSPVGYGTPPVSPGGQQRNSSPGFFPSEQHNSTGISNASPLLSAGSGPR
ncbi:uncharacterized protein LOC134221718 [Armigeres subalbatus]|uniref:uncharacterized protein LOC134221718 n=1 Tax=Armigeres subalbatus TaxID=124917 RepID=UPI002ED202DD